MKTKLMSMTVSAACLVALAASSSAGAMTLSARRVGQVLEFPYYTANANQGTLITLVNTTEHVKALKLRFHEAYNGRTVASFNVYLSPFDVWTADIVANGDATALATRDNSCTVPAFSTSLGGVNIANVAFSSAAYTGAQADGGPATAGRMREGHFEVFEMGEVTNDAHGLITAVEHGSNGVPADCGKVVAAWNMGGLWAANSSADLSAPTGGLYGSTAIVNAAQGTFFTVAPTTIDGFSSGIQHTPPQDAAPDFDTASTQVDGKYAASVDVGGHIVEARFSKAVDAVSALFMSEKLFNEYVVSASAGAQTDWVSTFPTKRFYVDPALNHGLTSLQPFDGAFGADGACAPFNSQQFDREELTMAPAGFPEQPPGTIAPQFCHETSVIALTPAGSSALKTSLTEPFDVSSVFSSGHFIIDLTNDGHFHPIDNHRLTTSAEGFVLLGLPEVGFVAENFVNANVTAGVLANYSGVYPHKSTAKCVLATDATKACP
ncbi:MAG: hypothetical protein ABJB01_02205 [Rudaea sp.]